MAHSFKNLLSNANLYYGKFYNYMLYGLYYGFVPSIIFYGKLLKYPNSFLYRCFHCPTSQSNPDCLLELAHWEGRSRPIWSTSSGTIRRWPRLLLIRYT